MVRTDYDRLGVGVGVKFGICRKMFVNEEQNFPQVPV